jgi:hypothetical protein
MSDMSILFGVEVGNVMVMTTQNRGFTPEEVAEQALAKIIAIGDNAPPVISEQAQAYREDIRAVLVHYMREAVRAHNVTLVSKFHKAGYPELVKILDT